MGGIRSSLFGYNFSIVFYNPSSNTLSYVNFVNAPGPVAEEVLVPEALKTSTCGRKMPYTADIMWQDHSGVTHTQEVDVGRQIGNPDFFSGCVVFYVTDEDVRTVVMADADGFSRLSDSDQLKLFEKASK